MTPKSEARRLRLERQRAIQAAMALGLRSRGLVCKRVFIRPIPVTAKEARQTKT